MSESTELPPGWAWATIDELARVGTGTTPSRDESRFWNNGVVPWITSSAVNQPFVLEAQQFISTHAVRETTLKLYPKNTLIIALYGEGKTRGKVSELLIDATINQALAALVLRAGADSFRPFLKYFLLSNYAALRRQAAGGMQPNLNLQLVKRIRVPIAPILEQRRIVAKIEELFSDLDAGVAALERAKANLKRYRAAVLKSAVEGKLTEAWRAEHPDTEPASKLLQRILTERRQKWESDQLTKFAAANKPPPKNWKAKYVEPPPPDSTELSKLPAGWCWTSVEQIAEAVRYGSSAKTNGGGDGIPVLRMGNIVDGALDCTELKYLPRDHAEFPELLLKRGDLLFNRTNSAELVGKSAVYEGQPDECSYASYLISVRCLAGCDPSFLCMYLNSAHGRRWIKSVVSQQVGQANVNGTKLQALAFPLPPIVEQTQIRMKVAEMLPRILAADSAIDTNLRRAARLRQNILKQAFEGKLVEQDAAEEPAAGLLERLRADRSDHEGNGKATASARVRRRRAQLRSS